MANGQGVLIIYTGGTIGSLPKDRNDPLSPLEPAPLDEIIRCLPYYDGAAGRIHMGSQWIDLGTHSWREPLDSSNITLEHWKEMAHVISSNYDEYEGFVILHGTDTMAYTASALSFMLENLTKPVIITGSQLPISMPRSDATSNLLTSIEIAGAETMGTTVVPEVTVFFRDHLFRGCRATKVSASSFSGFASPNFPALADAGEQIRFSNVAPVSVTSRRLEVNDHLEESIASIDLFPGMSTDLLHRILCETGLRGVVLKTFGSGNAPSTSEFLSVISDAIAKGTVIVDITQCRSGEVQLGLYDVSAGLLSRGVAGGLDMTPEAALAKLFVVLGSESDSEIATDRVQLNYRGEQRLSIFNLHFPSGRCGEDQASITVRTVRPMVGAERYIPSKLQESKLRIMDLETLDGKEGKIEFKVYLDVPCATSSESTDPRYLGSASKTYVPSEGPESVFLTVTDQVSACIDGLHENTLTLVNTGGSSFKWSKMQIACFADC